MFIVKSLKSDLMVKALVDRLVSS